MGSYASFIENPDGSRTAIWIEEEFFVIDRGAAPNQCTALWQRDDIMTREWHREYGEGNRLRTLGS